MKTQNNFAVLMVNLFVGFISWVFTVFVSLLLILVSIIVILFVSKREYVLHIIERQTLKMLQEAFKNEIEIDIFNLDIDFKDTDVIFKSNFVKIKSIQSEDEIVLLETKFILNYLEVLIFRFSPSIYSKNINISTNNKALTGVKPSKSFNPLPALKYITSLNVALESFDLNINDTQFNFKDLTLTGKSDRDNYSFQHNLSTRLVLNEINTTLFNKCLFIKDDIKCSLDAIDLKENSMLYLNMALKALPFDLSKNIIFYDIFINSLFVDFVLNNDNSLEDLNLQIDAEKLDIKIPPLFYDNRIRGDNFLIDSNYKNGLFNGLFKFNLEKKKRFSGNLSFNEKTFTLDVLGRNIESGDIAYYWPKNYLKDVSSWLIKSIKKAKVESAFVHVKTPMEQEDDLIVKVLFRDATLKYSTVLPEVHGASGMTLVKNNNFVQVNVEKAVAKNISILNSKAIYDTSSKILNLDLSLKSDFNNFINFFIPFAEVDLFLSKNLSGEAETLLKFQTKVSENNEKMFTDSHFQGWMDVKNLETPLILSEGKVSKFKFSKTTGDNMVFLQSTNNLKFNSPQCRQSGLVKDFNFQFLLNIQSGDITIKNFNLIGSGLALQGGLLLSYDKKNEILKYIDITTFNHCDNQFSYYFNKPSKKFTVKGKSINLPEIFNLPLVYFVNQIIDNFFEKETIKKQFNLGKFNTFLEQESNINIEKLKLFNNIVAENFSLIVSDKNIDIKSSLIEGKKHVDGSRFVIPNLENFLKAINSSNSDIKLKNGLLTVESNVQSNKSHKGWFTLHNYDIEVNNFNFGSKELKSDFEIIEDRFVLKNLRMQNINHTIFANGTIFLSDSKLDLDVFYTASSLDLINKVPYVSDLVSTLTFGNLKNGLLTLNYGITGTLDKPIIKLKTFNTSKKMLVNGVTIFGVTIGVNLIIIPLIVVLL